MRSRALLTCAVVVSLVVVSGATRAIAAPGAGGVIPSQPQPSGLLGGITKRVGGLVRGASGGVVSPSPTPSVTPSSPAPQTSPQGSGGGSGRLPVSSLPLPKPGDNVPDHLCLPEQLASSLPSDIPTCLDLTTCKNGLIRDLEQLPSVQLTELADYVQRVLGDVPACLQSLLPTAVPSPSPPTHTAKPPSRAPAPVEHQPAPARPATPVKRQPAFTG